MGINLKGHREIQFYAVNIQYVCIYNLKWGFTYLGAFLFYWDTIAFFNITVAYKYDLLPAFHALF